MQTRVGERQTKNDKTEREGETELDRFLTKLPISLLHKISFSHTKFKFKLQSSTHTSTTKISTIDSSIVYVSKETCFVRVQSLQEITT